MSNTKQFMCYSISGECRLKDYPSNIVESGAVMDDIFGADKFPDLEEVFSDESDAKKWLSQQKSRVSITAGTTGLLLDIEEYYYEETVVDEDGEFFDAFGMEFSALNHALDDNIDADIE